MNGLELSRRYFEEYGRPMLEKDFGAYADRIAAGLSGPGSERYGFDDEVSRDHDFCAGFCLWISDGDDAKIGFELAKAYRKLTSSFLGIPTAERERTGTSRYGVITYSAFFEPLVGENFASFTPSDFLYTPSHYLADATNGEVFSDPGGTFTALREKLLHGMPEDIRLKKLAANVAGMAQAGQYNYARILAHGEEGAAVMALCEFVKYTCAAVYLLNRRHAPYYKWMIRGMSTLPLLGELAPSLDFLLTAENTPAAQHTKSEIIEDICWNIAQTLKAEHLSASDSDFLEAHAREITKHISDPAVRNLHILTGA